MERRSSDSDSEGEGDTQRSGDGDGDDGDDGDDDGYDDDDGPARGKERWEPITNDSATTKERLRHPRKFSNRVVSLNSACKVPWKHGNLQKVD